MTSQQTHEGGSAQHRPGDDHHNDHWLELRVFAPRDPEERGFVFDRSTRVGAAAEKVAEDFGYASGNHTFQTRSDSVLDRELTLAARSRTSATGSKTASGGGPTGRCQGSLWT